MKKPKVKRRCVCQPHFSGDKCHCKEKCETCRGKIIYIPPSAGDSKPSHYLYDGKKYGHWECKNYGTISFTKRLLFFFTPLDNPHYRLEYYTDGQC